MELIVIQFLYLFAGSTGTIMYVYYILKLKKQQKPLLKPETLLTQTSTQETLTSNLNVSSKEEEEQEKLKVFLKLQPATSKQNHVETTALMLRQIKGEQK